MPHCRAIVVVVLSALATCACASTTSGARPSAFPRSPALPSGNRPSPMLVPPTFVVGDLMQTALGFQGVPYRPGGDSPSQGFDCSGFVRYVFGLSYIMLPRTVLEQSTLGHRIHPHDVHPGDLLFFATGPHGVSHVGIATGGAGFVHAPADRGVVRIDSVESPYWKDRFLEARRVIPGG